MNYHPHVVIGVCGRSGAGKSTLAGRLKEWMHHRRRDVPVVRKSFAEPLKGMLAYVGITKEHPLFRTMAQRVGTDCLRASDPDFWVKITADAIRSLSRPSVVVLDDVRFGNEANAVDLLVRLNTQRAGGLSLGEMVHVSERAWESMRPDLEFENNTPADLDTAVDAVAEKVIRLWEARR